MTPESPTAQLDRLISTAPRARCGDEWPRHRAKARARRRVRRDGQR